MKEKARVEAVPAVMDGRLRVAQAAHVSNLSERQVYRALAAARDDATGEVWAQFAQAGSCYVVLGGVTC